MQHIGMPDEFKFSVFQRLQPGIRYSIVVAELPASTILRSIEITMFDLKQPKHNVMSFIFSFSNPN